ncbi:hypothetical protein HN51_071612 [Arachis hypogaea]|uniref:uncharacterized protein isoform X1 n=2 Tax=Arachis hypogaea TaxID=3818 RepID=UPI000DED35E5|nr:uncharacterized protein LOC112751759 isoform X1 [Arachis hypogaea]XP_025656772.1 uncharacterized protein LOC112751759 isoform X1 [Arachis hypogaea]XP_025656773.1 uncharacterized protein LOC112751759 isoform X1 [Arachis hypogaea]XP_025656774.1 uncharacterized protein LOC112751759 isoform X1 [Arachis hypogaea]XP_025656775.1 uncharacterized protein LOC112751759 isoform X1 [Arachis hypogaea]XP_025656776.1 uncharacterized protein LOC112751759 isoform X1 [Arachis hypogaea]XP_025656777.1 uncharac
MDETTEGKAVTVKLNPKSAKLIRKATILLMFPRRSQRRKILRFSKLLSKLMLMQLRIRVLGTQWKMLGCAHVAIYDGHGGRLAAEYAQKHLHGNVISAGLPRELLDVKAAKRAILDGFRKTDESLLQESSEGDGRMVPQLSLSGYWDKKFSLQT